jgi:hypothetical protein
LNVKSSILKEELEKMFKEIYCINTVLKEYRYSMDRVGIKEEEEEEQEKEKEEEETVNANASTTPIFDFPLILEYGMKKGADESYCRKFYDYYEKKEMEKWKDCDEINLIRPASQIKNIMVNDLIKADWRNSLSNNRDSIYK